MERGWIALEYNQFGNAAFAAGLKQACNDRVRFSIWMTRDFSAAEARAACIQSQAEGFIAEGEIPAEISQGVPNPQAQNWPALVDALKDLPLKGRAVATSFGPFQRYWEGRVVPAADLAAPLIRAGWYLMPYVYPAENVNDTVARKLFYATHYTHEQAPAALGPGEGWYEPEPVLGVYGGKTLASPEFDGWRQCASVSLWDASEVA